jgi:hypothetical protein
MNEHYTYLHTRNDTGAVFYVGRGACADMPSSRGHAHNPEWLDIVRDVGYQMHLTGLFETDLEAETHQLMLKQEFQDMPLIGLVPPRRRAHRRARLSK